MPRSVWWFVFEVILFAAGFAGLSWLLAVDVPEWVAPGAGLLWVMAQISAHRRYQLWRYVETADACRLAKVYDGI